MAVSITLFVLFCAVSYSIAAYDVPRCSGSAIEVTATKTVLQTNIIPMTTTAIQVLTATSLLTRTAHFPSTVSQAEFITLFQEPVFLPQTRFVTETNVRAKSLVYTSTEFRASFVTESHLAADVLPVYVTTQGYVTSTLQSVVVIPSELTSRISLTKLVTERIVRTSVQYQPLYVTKTQTKSFFITRTVYQKKIDKSTVDVIKTAALTSTVYQCATLLMNRFFGY